MRFRASFPSRNTFLFLTTVLLFASPSSIHFAQATDPRNASPTVTASQGNKASLLEQESLVSHIESGRYSQVRMKSDVKVVGPDFFTRYEKDLGLSKDDTFKPVFSRANPLLRAKSQTVTRYRQHYKNLPVIGMEYVLQTDSANHVLAASGKIISGLSVDISPSVPEPRALEIAKRAVPAQVYSWDKHPANIPKGTLAISFKDFKINLMNAHLVYRFTISSEKPSRSYVVEIDAHTGDVLNKINNHIFDVVDWNQNVKGCQFVGDGINTPDRTTFPLCDKGVDGRYRLMCRPDYTIGECASGLKMIDARRPNPQAHNGEDQDQDYVFTDEHQQTTPVFADVEDRVGGYLYLGMLFALKSYYVNFNWAGYDGLGEIPIVTYVRPTEEPSPAFYDQDSGSIVFDPVGTIEHDANYNVNIVFSAAVAGHEFTHGVIHHMHPGFVNDGGEASSLNESFADILGVSAAYYGACYPAQDLKDCLKRLDQTARLHPKSGGFPTTYKGFYYAESDGCNGSVTCYHTPEKTISCDESNNNCDPEHRNSTVHSYMFYLLASGGSGVNDPPLNHPYNVEGIGPSKAWRIAFQTMLAQFTPTSTYSEIRDGWIAAAEDLYGKKSNEARAVTLAWYAVGIGDVADVSHKPADGDQNVAPWPATLEWDDQGDEVIWEVQASTSPRFDSDVHKKQTLMATMSPTSRSSSVDFNLKPDTTYYWRVRAKRNPSSSGNSGSDSQIITQPSQGPTLQSDWGDWSLLRYFKTDARVSKLKAPVGTTPKVYPWGDEFKWTGVDGGTQYWLQTSEDEDLGLGSNLGPSQATLPSPIQNTQPNIPLQSISLTGVYVDPNDPDNREGSNGIKHTLPVALKVNHTYYWGVLPYGPAHIEGNWSNHQKGEIFETSTPRTTLASPTNAATVSPWGITLQWEETPGAVGYIVKLSKHQDVSDNLYTGRDPTGTSVVISLPGDTEGGSAIVQDPQVGAGGPVAQGLRRDYYWSVTPKGPPPWNETGVASETWGFNIDWEATKPVLVSPSNGSHVPYKQPGLRFIWDQVDHAVEYVFTLYGRNADGSRGASRDSKGVPVSQEYHDMAYVDLNGEGVTEKVGYCWQVQAIGPDDIQGPPSDTFCYRLSADKPILTAPADGATVEYHPTVFTWNSEWAPDGYAMTVHEVTGSGSGILAGAVSLSGKTYSAELKPGTSYYWIVTALGPVSGDAIGSEFAHFSTKAAPCDAPDAPQILDPPGSPDGQYIPNPYQYRWSSVPGAVQYEFTVYWIPNIYNPPDRRVVYHNYYNGTVSDSVPITCAGPNAIYVWSIRAKSSCGAWGAVDWSKYFAC